MRVEDCYQENDAKVALPLVFIERALYEEGFPTLTAMEKSYLDAQQFSAALGEIAVIRNQEGQAVKVCVGQGCATVAQAIAQVVLKLPPAAYKTYTPLDDQALLMWALAQYRFDEYKKNEKSCCRLVMDSETLSAVLPEARAIYLVRDLINKPMNALGPSQLASVLSELACSFNASFQQWVGNELLEANFPAIHAVGRASTEEPRLLSLTWGNPTHPKVTLVGKGVCFDSGGLDIKPASAMRLMKKDMGGAAQVLGLAQWLMTKNVPIYLQVLIPAVENAISSNAYRPGDVLTMRNGLTVEVDNTDAEGRLILADALVKACEDKPALLVDFATLTGAARVAVGTEISALFTNDDQVAAALYDASIAKEDPIWRMPLYQGYASLFDSSIADFANSGSSSYAGAITAALFLQRFIDNDIPWVHFDIMAWNVTTKPGKPEGGEAMGMRALGHYILHRFST